MTKYRFIGDVHAKFDQYVEITKSAEGPTIQVGDFGAGFKDLPEMGHSDYFIRGNHDSPDICSQSLNWIEDGTYWPTQDMMFVGGALSIDQHRRVEGVSWWRDEEISISRFNQIIAEYEINRPRIMVTHDCPEMIARKLFFNNNKTTYQSVTRQALQTMYEIHQPDFWIYGHWHIPKNELVDRTRFICLAELQYIDLEI